MKMELLKSDMSHASHNSISSPPAPQNKHKCQKQGFDIQFWDSMQFFHQPYILK